MGGVCCCGVDDVVHAELADHIDESMLVSRMMAPESGRAAQENKYGKKGGRQRVYLMGAATSGRDQPLVVPEMWPVRHRLLQPSTLDPACMHCQQAVATAPYYHCLACSRRVCTACEAAEKHDPGHVLAVIKTMV